MRAPSVDVVWFWQREELWAAELHSKPGAGPVGWRACLPAPGRGWPWVTDTAGPVALTLRDHCSCRAPMGLAKLLGTTQPPTAPSAQSCPSPSTGMGVKRPLPAQRVLQADCPWREGRLAVEGVVFCAKEEAGGRKGPPRWAPPQAPLPHTPPSTLCLRGWGHSIRAQSQLPAPEATWGSGTTLCPGVLTSRENRDNALLLASCGIK